MAVAARIATAPTATMSALGSCVAAVTAAACHAQAAPRGELAEYALTGAPSWRVPLPTELHEISGLALTPDGRLFAHGDEEGTVFELDPRSGRVVKRFALAPTGAEPDLGKKAADGRVTGDFEDIAIVGARFFLVTSNGVLVEFAEGGDGASVAYTAHVTDLHGRCEVEGLTYDARAGALLLLCKRIHRKAERDQVVVYAWSLREQRLAPTPRLAIPYAELARVTGAPEFNGSALAFTPGGSLALIAGPQRLFVEIAADGGAPGRWRPVGGGRLDRAAQRQPEGIAFLPDGTLLIASEGGKGEATVSGYRPRQP